MRVDVPAAPICAVHVSVSACRPGASYPQYVEANIGDGRAIPPAEAGVPEL